MLQLVTWAAHGDGPGGPAVPTCPSGRHAVLRALWGRWDGSPVMAMQGPGNVLGQWPGGGGAPMQRFTSLRSGTNSPSPPDPAPSLRGS